MKRLLLAAAAATLVFAAPAAAHPTTWWWSAAKAQNALIDSTLTWDDPDTGGTIEDVVEGARCIGQGPSTRNGGPRLYKHFRCFVVTLDQYGDEDRYWIRLHVVNKWRYVYDFVSRP